MERSFIQNREGKKISVLVEHPSTPQEKVAFVMHGLGGSKEQHHIAALAGPLLARGYVTVRFDATNSLGESDGDYADATVTNYVHDLEDVLSWGKSQPWYQEPFVLAGESLGAFCSAAYAEEHPEHVSALVLIAPMVSGGISIGAKGSQELLAWRESGWRIEESVSKPGVLRKLPWSHVRDRLRYDLLPHAKRLAMPTLLVTGEKDRGASPGHVAILYDELPGPKELHVIPDAPHTFRDPAHIEELRRVVDTWLQEQKEL